MIKINTLEFDQIPTYIFVINVMFMF